MHWFMKPSQSNMYAAIVFAVIAAYLAGLLVVLQGNGGLLLIGMVLLSPVAMAVLRWWWEDRFDRSFFNPHVMSFGFVLGDTVVLPIALTTAQFGWAELPATGWHRRCGSCWWLR